MEDLQDALQSILSDPAQMARVAALAESLGLKPPERDATGNGQQAAGSDADPVGAVIGRPPKATGNGQQAAGSDADPVGAVIGRPSSPEFDGFNLEKLMGLLAASGGGEARVFSALRPALSPEGQNRVDRALRAARLSRLAGVLLTQRRADHV